MQLQVILLGISTLSISCFDADKHGKRAVADREKKQTEMHTKYAHAQHANSLCHRNNEN